MRSTMLLDLLADGENAMCFPIDVRHGIAVITAHGRLNLLRAPGMERSIRLSLDQGATKIVVDLSRVKFLDLTALGRILAGMKLARSRGCDLRLAAAGPQPSLILEMTRLNRVLLSFADVKAACAA
jgi:anti-sigma B factor antagonist